MYVYLFSFYWMNTSFSICILTHSSLVVNSWGLNIEWINWLAKCETWRKCREIEIAFSKMTKMNRMTEMTFEWLRMIYYDLVWLKMTQDNLKPFRKSSVTNGWINGATNGLTERDLELRVTAWVIENVKNEEKINILC